MLFLLFFLGVPILAMLGEPQSVPYRLSAGLVGALFGGIGGAIGALLDYAIKTRFRHGLAVVGVGIGLIASQLVEHGAQEFSSRVYDSAVRPQVDRVVKRSRLAKEIAEQPFYRAMLIVEEQPTKRFIDQLVDETLSGSSSAEMEARARDYTSSFRQRNASKALASEPASVQKVLSTQADILRGLAVIDRAACGDFALRGVAARSFSELARTNTQFWRLIEAHALSVFDAIVEGHGRLRHSQPATDADWQMVSRTLEAYNWTPDYFEAVSSPQALAKLPLDRVCKISLEFILALLSVGDDAARARLLRTTVEGLLKS